MVFLSDVALYKFYHGFFSIVVTSLIQIGNAKVMPFQIEDLRKTLEYTRTLTAGNPC